MLRIIQEKAILSHQLGKQASQSRMILAKIRMQHGRQRTSADALLPRWRPYKALCRIFKACTQWGSSFEYKRHPVDPDEGFLDPLTNMFGSIVPFSLRVAATNWERVVNLSVECANVQQELLSTMSSIRKLQHSLNQR
ncbi:hypothetical protein KR018_005499 [Drosophila ironensis]|nr:hypothetical protein KR018_005499 [Drosophila ironensis]